MLLALVTCIASLEHILSLRNPTLKPNEIASGARLSVHGPFDQNGLDSGITSSMKEDGGGLWQYGMMTVLPSSFQEHIRMANEDAQPNLSRELGDFQNLSVSVSGDISTVMLLKNIVNIDSYPPSPYLAYRITVNETNRQYHLSPVDSRQNQVVIYLLLGALPILTEFASIRIYLYAFYVIKVNEFGKAQIESFLPTTIQSKL